MKDALIRLKRKIYLEREVNGEQDILSDIANDIDEILKLENSSNDIQPVSNSVIPDDFKCPECGAETVFSHCTNGCDD